MNTKSILASALIVLGSTNVRAADDYCTYPLLYAFDIRPACEQFGAGHARTRVVQPGSRATGGRSASWRRDESRRDRDIVAGGIGHRRGRNGDLAGVMLRRAATRDQGCHAVVPGNSSVGDSAWNRRPGYCSFGMRQAALLPPLLDSLRHGPGESGAGRARHGR